MTHLEEPVQLSEPQNDWPATFAAEKNHLQLALGVKPGSIKHIGSTAVPGLIAKPVVDLMVGIESYPPSPALADGLEVQPADVKVRKATPDAFLLMMRECNTSASTAWHAAQTPDTAP